MCSRGLDVPGAPLSLDCGGDCWGCVSLAEWEAGAGAGRSLAQYRDLADRRSADPAP
jgi:hypothetical protein